MALATMANHDLPDQIPSTFDSLQHLTNFADVPPEPSEDRYLSEIQSFNNGTLKEIRVLVLPKFGI